ncbi:MAG TPA: hypothetical protein VGX46_03780, partial [Vicinamibacterales bacterium]|nr:hypothetical protein [Vicinamibacterales bacterium]
AVVMHKGDAGALGHVGKRDGPGLSAENDASEGEANERQRRSRGAAAHAAKIVGNGHHGLFWPVLRAPLSAIR